MLHQEIMKWAQSDDTPNREGLEGIYRAVIDPGCKEMVLMTLSTSVLIKAICRGVYYATLDTMAKWKVIYFLSQCFGMSESAISSYLPSRAHKYVNVRQITPSGEVVTFPNIPAAARATGIIEPAITAAITRGCRASNYRFEADIFKPVLR